MNKLVVGSDPAIKATFHSKRYGSDGWLDSYELDLDAIDFRATVKVQNPGYGHPPTQLFNEIAANWQGWHDKKCWVAMDAELEMEATADVTGHVTLTITIPGYESMQLWTAQARLLLEAGQLERLAEDAAIFFAKRDA